MQRNVLIKVAAAMLLFACGESSDPATDFDVVDGSGPDAHSADADVLDADVPDADTSDSTETHGPPVVEEVVVNDDRVCARAGTELWCWGNRLDELADADTPRSSAAPVLVRDDVTGIGGSYETFCLLDSDGVPHCTSDAGFSVVGGADLVPMTALTRVPGLLGATTIDAGHFHACALVAEDLYCWGWNGASAIRPPATDAYLPPTLVKQGIVDFATASSHTCAIDTEGTVECWGFNGNMQLGVEGRVESAAVDLPTSAVSIDAAGFTTCVVTDSEDAWCWGSASAVQFGDEDVSGHARPFRTDARIRGVSVATSSVCVVTVSGNIQCAGQNGSFVTNPASTEIYARIPAVIPGIDDAKAVFHAHTGCAIRSGGRLWCWGSNAYGAAGIGADQIQAEPWLLGELPSLNSMGAGTNNTCVSTTGGAVACWGRNTSGVLGPDTPPLRSSTERNTMPFGVADAVIRVGRDHACAAGSDVVTCWGGNSSNQTGHGVAYGFVPFGTALPGLPGAPLVDAGTDHSCVGLASGEIQCWGGNAFGQLGRPYTRLFNDPGPAGVGDATNITRLETGDRLTCFLADRPTAPGWHGCFGLMRFNETATNSPTSPHGLPPAVDLAVGDQHVCILSDAGEVLCYGENEQGQVAPGEAASLSEPVAVIALPGPVSSISAGGTHSCALVDGVPWCWGDNRHGQLGRPALDTAMPPAPIELPSTVLALALGDDHSVAWLEDGTLWTWGSNAHGKSGNPAAVHYVLVPEEVLFERR